MGFLDAPADRRLPILQRVMHMLDRGDQNVTLAFVGDSVGDGTNRWVYQWALKLAAANPAYTTIYYPWSATTYDQANTVVLGTGSGTPEATQRVYATSNAAISNGASLQVNANGRVETLTSGTLVGTARQATGAAGQTSSFDPVAPLLLIYNGCKSGTGWDYPTARALEMVGKVNPDAVFIMHGHNESTYTTTIFYERMVTCIENVAAQAPDAEVVLCSQNREVAPATNAGAYQGQRRGALHQYAQQRGFGFVDIYQKFEDTGNVAAYLNNDGVHPTDAGGTPLIVNEIAASARLRRGMLLGTRQQPPELRQAAANPLYAEDFSSPLWDGTTAGFASTFGWTLSNVTAAKDTTNVEPPSTQAVALSVTTGGGGIASMFKDVAGVAGATAITDLYGKWVTFAARMLVGAGQQNTAMRLQLDDGSNTVIWNTLSPGSLWIGNYVTIVKHILMQNAPAVLPTRLRLTVLIDSANSSTPNGAGTIQRMCVVTGRYHPRLFGVAPRVGAIALDGGAP